MRRYYSDDPWGYDDDRDDGLRLAAWATFAVLLALAAIVFAAVYSGAVHSRVEQQQIQSLLDAHPGITFERRGR